jgi:ubiquinol-cytochrome c reductase cytochrome c1 subunit
MILRSLLLSLALAVPAFGAGDVVNPPQQKWSFSGPFGKFDQAQLQRGFQVYKEVCAACHSLNLISFGNLSDKGALGYSKAQAEALAADYKIKALNDNGEAIERNGRPADKFPAPFANELAAAAVHGKAPPDLSLIAKARSYERNFPFSLDIFTQYQEQAPDYIYALLTGYKEPPKGFVVSAGSHYNTYMAGNLIAMAAPLSDGRVDYSDGSPKTVAQYSKDVTAFLMWTAEPKLEERKRIGLQVLAFLLLLSGLLYFTKKKVWSSVH